MIKDEQKVIIGSICGGLSMWVIDALIDSYVFSKKPFLDSLAALDLHELYFRSIFLVAFIFFGIVVSRLMYRQKKVEKEVKKSEEKYRSLMESIGDSMYLVDKNYMYLFMNKKHLSRLGLTESNFQGQGYGDFHSPEETNEFVKLVDRVFETGESIQHEHLSRRDDRYFLRTLSPVKNSDGEITAVTVISKDVSELKEMEKKMRTISMTDELTGLYNRRGFLTLADQLLKLAKRQKKGTFMLYADMDNLKAINDTWGHKEGDLALIDSANIFKMTYRESDIVARLGGDEFAVIPVGNAGDNIEIITSRLQKNIDEHNAKAKRNFKLSISFGVSYYDAEKSLSLDDVLLQAERLMYEQKMLKRKS